MSGEEQVNSFYKYLISNGYYFDKDLIENYLLSLKVKPFEILTGNSGTGKTKLSQLFAKFISDEDNFHSNKPDDDNYVTVKAKTNFSSWKNMGWTLAKDDVEKILPIRNCEINCDMFVDGIHSSAHIDVGTQLYYSNEELIGYFKKLYEKDENSIVDLKINCSDIKKLFSDYDEIKDGSINIVQKSNKTAANNRQWFLNKNIFKYLPFNYGYIGCNIKVND